MSSIPLSQFQTAQFKLSKRTTSCKNCWDWPGMELKKPIPPGGSRIVVSGGFGPSTRHVTLCPDCARHALARIQALAQELERALEKAPGFIIKDWAGNQCLAKAPFNSFEDAWAFIHQKFDHLPEKEFDEEMGEYFVELEKT